MSIRRFTIPAFGRSRVVSLIVLLAFVLVIGAGSALPAVAQDASTEEHPLVGTWVIDAGQEGPALASFTSDGIAIDSESTGEIGIGTWSATSATAGDITFVIFFAEEEEGVSGTIVIRASFDYDAATDTASGPYTVTGAGYDGTVYFTDEGTATATRVPAESSEMGGSPIPALVLGTPVASPAAA